MGVSVNNRGQPGQCLGRAEDSAPISGVQVLISDIDLTPAQANNSEHRRPDSKKNMLVCGSF